MLMRAHPDYTEDQMMRIVMDAKKGTSERIGAAMRISFRQEDLYLKLLSSGMAMNVYCNVLVNTGVAMSILPPTGNTLPFISYGGSALLMDSIAMGVILNISANRRTV